MQNSLVLRRCRSLAFYQDVLGMDLLSEFSDFTTLHFLTFNHDGEDSSQEKKNKPASPTPYFNLPYQPHPGVLELTHNHGTESDPTFQGYSSGNTDPGRGFGYIAISVEDVEEACERLERLCVAFKKRPGDGKMGHIAFILDPDRY